MGDLTFVKNAGIHYMYHRSNGNGRAALRIYHVQFLIDECRITEFFNGYIVNFMKQVRSTSPGMMLITVQAWKKPSLMLWLID
ncbi:hypothetical protein TNCV_4339691 [Trichonephila clavipes]|nr:hypothetical protein TNCV_4339691 [Trichonephila clavipes]